MSVRITGIREVDKAIAKVDRTITRERQAVIRKAATKTLVPAMKARAKASPGKAGGLLSKYTTARNGKNGVVVVGPRTGKSRAWYRHMFIVGSRAHTIAPKAKRVMFSADPPFVARGTVKHPGLPSNPFVADGAASARSAFVAAVKAGLFTPQGGN